MTSILPEVDITVSDGGLGTVGVGGFSNVAVVGTCSLGTPNTYYAFTNIDSVKATLGYGPAAEQCAHILQVAGGVVYCCPASPTTAGTIGTSTYSRAASATSTGVVLASGTATATARMVLRINGGGGGLVSGGLVTFETSLDGGVTFSPTGGASASATVNGVTFSFVGLFYVGDQFRINVTAGVAATGGTIATRASGPVSTGTVVLSGPPADSYDARIQATSTGIVESGTALQFKYSLDGGVSFSAAVSVPGSGVYALGGTGLTATFSGVLNTGDMLSVSTTSPGYGLAEAQAAFSVLESRSNLFGIVHFVGSAVGATTALAATASAGFAVGAASIAQGATARFRFTRSFTDASNSTDSELISAFQNVAANRLSVGAGLADLNSALDGRSMKVNAQWVNVARLAAVPLSESSAYVGRGAVQGVTKIYRDESLSPSLDGARFVTLRTFAGSNGFYITRPKMMALPSSDYTQAPNCRVVDTACAITRTGLLPYLNGNVRVDRTTGFILEQEARQIEVNIESQLNAVLLLQPDVSAITVVLKRDWDILRTNIIKVRIRIVPLGRTENIEVDIGFTNPALGA